MLSKNTRGLIILANHIVKNYDNLINSSKSEKNKLNKQILLDIAEVGIKAASPQEAIFSNVKIENNVIKITNKWQAEIKSNTKVFVIGAGKATAGMAKALESILGDKIFAGLINVLENDINLHNKTSKIEFHPAGHPYVTQDSIDGTKKIISLVKNLREDDLVICLISGGGSALLEKPIEGVTLADLEQVFNLITNSGGTIHELNTIRKNLSLVKGGKLARIIQPAQILSLIISDVVGDTLDTIASGPTAPDNTTHKDAINILNKFDLKEQLPDIIKRIYSLRSYRQYTDTVKANDPIFQRVLNIIIASNLISCLKMEQYAKKLGYEVKIFSTTLEGEAKFTGKVITDEIQKQPNKTILIAGGETTVSITGSGKGGRNQELALAASEYLKGKENFSILSVGSDGIDGPTEAAGAIVDGYTIAKGTELGLDSKQYLENNDSYNFLSKTNNLILTGPTGTNVGDFIIAVRND
ncbi:MAG: glycerate kinase [Asgard group archaeon]|nr:glycerate kinase [Asgard group archaeon]